MHICIVGLLPKQFQLLVSANQLSLIETETLPRVVKARTGHADIVICMTKFINHHLMEVVKKSSKRVLMCNGGIASLKIILSDIRI